MRAVYIICIIVIVLFLIGMVKIKLDVSYEDDEEVRAILRLLFLKFRLLPLKNKKPKKEKNKNEEKAVLEKKQIKKEEHNKQKQSFGELLEMVKVFLDPLPDFLKSLSKGLKIKKLKVIWCIAKEDADQTAILYGKSCAIFYSVLGILNSFFDVDMDKIRIYPDFIGEQSFCNVFFRLQIRIGRLLMSGLKYLAAVFMKLINNNLKSLKRVKTKER